MKKNILLFSIILLFTLLFTACPPPPASETEIYTVTISSQGGALITMQNVYEGSTVSRVEEPYSDGFTDVYFNGWYTDLTFADKWDFSNDTVSSDMTLYANWLSATPNLSYTFNVDEYIIGIGTATFPGGNCIIPGYHNDGVNGVFPVTTIPANEFNGQVSIVTVYMPSTITTVGQGIFINCTNLVTFTIRAVIPPDAPVAVPGEGLFSPGIDPANFTLYIPVGTLNAYTYAPGWTSYNVFQIESD